MPLYEFECPGCGAQFEELLRHSDSAQDVSCPECGRREPERLLSSTVRASGASDGGAYAAAAACSTRGRYS